MDEENAIYTVGTSTRTFEEFLALLQEHDIEDAVDVRSFPTSGRFPHFKRDQLAKAWSELWQPLRQGSVRVRLLSVPPSV